MDKIVPFFPGTSGHWSAGVPLPGGDFAVDGVEALIARLQTGYDFLDAFWARRLIRAYGTDAWTVLGDAEQVSDLGQSFGATLTEREVVYLMAHEFARTAEDIVWRRNKLGLRLSAEQIAALDAWMQTHAA